MKKYANMLKSMAVAVLSIIVICYVLIFLGRNTYDVVPYGMTGAKVTLGSVDTTAVHGFVWKLPFITEVVKLNTKQQTYTYCSEDIKANNIQKLKLNCSVIYQLTPNNVPKMIANVDKDQYVETLLVPRISSALQETIGKNDALLLVTEPEMIREATQYILADQLKVDNYIQIHEVLFDTPKFSDEFEDAVNKKLTEEQLLEYAKIHTKKVEEEAKQALSLAMVDAKVAEQLSKTLNNPLIVKYEAMKALQKWDGRINLPSALMLSGYGTGMLPIFPAITK